MLKRLFTSNTRIKLLTIFLLNPDEEYFIRELTRTLDEQINSIRRELDNLKKLGLLKSKAKNRKKFYVVDKNFICFNELRSLIIKGQSNKDEIGKKIAKLGTVELLVLSGVFVEKENASVDLLLIGEVDKQKLEQLLNAEMDTENPVKFAIMSKEEFHYRLKCKDKFIAEILSDPKNLIAINHLEK